MKGLQVYRLVDEGAPGIGSFFCQKTNRGKSRGTVHSTLITFAWSGKRGGNTYNETVKRQNVESRNVCEKILIFTLERFKNTHKPSSPMLNIDIL